MEQTYKIIRFYAPHVKKPNEVIHYGYTLEQAIQHTNDPTTKTSDYFDGREKESPTEMRISQLGKAF